jgi:hypothetical protein
MKTQPPIFRGSDEPLDADYWISAIEDKLRLFENTDDEKVIFAAHQLQDVEGVWWRGYKAQVGAGHRITWDELRKAFHDHHIPKSVLKLKRDEFCKLKQGNKSVQEYTNAFNYLSQYAPHDVDEDEKKQDCYMEVLSLKLKAQHSNIDFKDFNDLVRKSIKAEYNMNALEADNRKRYAPSSMGCSSSSQRPRTRPSPPTRIPGFGAPQLMWMAHCPPAPQRQPPRPSGQPGGGGGSSSSSKGSSYNCGGHGHFSRECPSPKKNGGNNVPKPPMPPPPNFQKVKNAQPPKNGKLNHITIEEANDDEHVLVGMVLLNSINTQALFDSGASHSFMSRKICF